MNASILLVEDHRDIAEMVFDYLEARGFSVDYAADGRAVLRLGVDNRYDAIVMDVMLPGMDGLELCRRLRDEARLAAPVLMLVVLYCSAWVAYDLARKAVSPVVRLARLVRDINVETPDLAAFATTEVASGADTEIETLSHALSHLMARVDQLIERERNFTREASHELRSPLTVILMASDNLLGRALDDGARGMVEKMRAAAQDMVELTEALLLLAREHEGALATEAVSVNQVLRQELVRCRMIYAAKQLQFRFEAKVEPELDAAPRLLAIVLGNLLRNACAYTDAGAIIIAVDSYRVTIRDSGIGMSEEHLERVFTPYFRVSQARGSGHGSGLTLVKRISDRCGWSVEIASEPERGTQVEVRLPAARVVNLPQAVLAGT